LGYGFYLGQAALLHLWSYMGQSKRSIRRFFGYVLASFAVSLGLIFVALNAANAVGLGPF
jgi:hypothetical protein